jgi:predicted membrane GTPase involved in stress response
MTTLKKIKEFLQHEVEDHGYLKYQECFSQDQYVSFGRNELAEGLLELISKWEYENE